MEDTIERIAGYFRYAAQGLEEHKQILYFLGPLGVATHRWQNVLNGWSKINRSMF